MTTDVMTTRTIGVANQNGHIWSAPMHKINSVRAMLKTWWAWHQRYQETVRELEALDMRSLDDLGIAPCDIPTIAMQAANKAQAAE